MSEMSTLLDQWGYPTIFVIVVLGNMGVPVPEETVLIVAGYLVWQGHLRRPCCWLITSSPGRSQAHATVTTHAA